MELTNVIRFDKLEFQILDCSKRGSYYVDKIHEERALLLMKDGILKTVPVKKWHIRGYELTEKGEKYYLEFMELLRNKHGHVWKTYADTDPDYYKEGGFNSDKIDIFVLDSDNHNGPGCKNCGYSFCHHCTSEFDVPECTNRPIEI